jgi:hypothetical protein
MSRELITGLITIITGGTLTELINILLKHFKKEAVPETVIDSKISEWEHMIDKNAAETECAVRNN